MFTSADVIAALHRRRRRSLRPGPAPGEFPPGWRAWFEHLALRPGQVRGAASADIVASLVARAPRPRVPGQVPADRWQAFTALWRQHWEPPHPDERGLRAVSAGGSGAFHLVLLLAMAVLLFVPPLRGPTQAGEDRAIEVTWIGEGTPDEAGGGAPAAVVPDADASPSQAAASAPAPSVASDASPAVPPAAEVDPAPPSPAQPVPAPTPDPAAVPAQQPLAVTETPEPDPVFAVPPPPDVAVPSVAPRDTTVELRTREIVLPDAPELRRPEMQAVRVPQASPRVEQPLLDVAEREIPSPPREVSTPEIALPTPAAPVVQHDAQARVREIPMPQRAPAEDGGAAQVAQDRPDEGADATPADALAGEPGRAGERAPATADGTQGARPEADSAGSGLSSAAPPGALADTAPPGDDWDAATRDQAGGQSGTAGLFNRDGRPQLPPGSGGRVGGGLPPGTITEDYEKIDRMGTWLRRPPNDFDETTLDRFWVPHENLLEEWVRRSIRTVLIPIPGSSKSIRCDVALLAFGGGCGITDPNMQDVEAEARPPPDVPFRPELQEAQDDL